MSFYEFDARDASWCIEAEAGRRIKVTAYFDQRLEEQIDVPRDAVLPLIAGLIDQYQRLEEMIE